jgi:uncharacterized membrane protein
VLSFLNSADPFIKQGDWVVLSVSLINLLVFLYVLVLMWDEFNGRPFRITVTGGSTEQEEKENELQDRPQ